MAHPWIWARFAARLQADQPPLVRKAWGWGSRLGVPHSAEPVLVGVEAHDAVIPHPELLPASCEVDVFGREAQEAGVSVDGLLPQGGLA